VTGDEGGERQIREMRRYGERMGKGNEKQWRKEERMKSGREKRRGGDEGRVEERK